MPAIAEKVTMPESKKEARVQDALISLRLPQELLDKLDTLAEKETKKLHDSGLSISVSRAAMIRMLIEKATKK